jgi:quercetin dioxygenase-like cupin family protein
MSHSADVAHGHDSLSVKGEDPSRAIAHLPRGEGIRSLWVFDELLTYKVPSQRTGGAYTLFEVSTQPGAGPPPHVHHREDESYYVLEGEYEFLGDSYSMKVETGSLIYVPRGVLHAHKGAGDHSGRMLLIQTPGGLYERFFENVGKPAYREESFIDIADQPDMEKVVEVAAEYGIEIQQPIVEK